MHDRDRIAKHKPLGPDTPPRPSEVEDARPEPMAVANDKATRHGESFLPTSAPMDAYDEDVARRYKQVADPKARTQRRDENRAMEDPPGFTAPDRRGWKHMEEQE